jgi:hypothetical protein
MPGPVVWAEVDGKAVSMKVENVKSEPPSTPQPAAASDDERLRAARIVMDITALLRKHQKTRKEADQDLAIAFVGKTWSAIQKLPADELAAGLAVLTKTLDGVAAMRAEPEPVAETRERLPGED